jgi:hypothetical protein
MTPYEIELAKALWCCSFLPGSSHKRFCRNMAETATHKPDHELSLRQLHYMELMAWRYRRQLPREFVPHQKPLDLPQPIKLTSESKQSTSEPHPDLFGDSGGKDSAA